MISEFDVEMAYKYLLGRSPESREVVIEKAKLHNSLDELRQSMFRSGEFKEKWAELTGEPVPDRATAAA